MFLCVALARGGKDLYEKFCNSCRPTWQAPYMIWSRALVTYLLASKIYEIQIYCFYLSAVDGYSGNIIEFKIKNLGIYGITLLIILLYN